MSGRCSKFRLLPPLSGTILAPLSEHLPLPVRARGTVRLTHRLVENLDHAKASALARKAPDYPHPVDLWDAALPGFGLRVSPQGKRTFQCMYRANGRRRRLRLGAAPVLTLADARKRARRVLLEVSDGGDPAAVSNTASEDSTVLALARAPTANDPSDLGGRIYRLLNNPRKAKATTRERLRIFGAEIVPAWGHRRVAEISRQDVRDLRDAIDRRGAPVLANRVVSVIRLVWNELLDGELVESNPAHRVKPLAETPRSRWLEREEVAALWHALDHEHPTIAAALRFALLSVSRIGPVRAMRWDQIHGRTWRIPAEGFKGKRAFWVPLSPELDRILATRREVVGRSPWVFPAVRGGRSHLVKTDPAMRRVSKRAEFDPPATAHDFRETFRTWATRPRQSDDPDIPEGLGIAPEVADAVLGHSEHTLALERYHGRPEEHRLAAKREALRRWGDWVAGTTALNQ